MTAWSNISIGYVSTGNTGSCDSNCTAHFERKTAINSDISKDQITAVVASELATIQ